MKLSIHEDYLRSLLFGLQDGLVSTTGVVVGISAGVHDKAIVILASFVAVSVEASSMAAGQYSSEKAVHQMDESARASSNSRKSSNYKTGKHTDSLILGAVIMFFSYLAAGLIPIIPILFIGPPNSIPYSITFAFIGLFAMGFIKGKIVAHKPFRSALEILVIGGVATAIGLLVGYMLRVSNVS